MKTKSLDTPGKSSIELDAEIEVMLSMAKTQVKHGLLSESGLWKTMVQLAARLTLAGEPLKAMELLYEVPTSYWKLGFPHDLIEDEEFMGLAGEVADVWTQDGYVYMGPEVHTNMPGGQA